MASHLSKLKEFSPQEPPKLKPPKEELISIEALSTCDGTTSSNPTYVAIMGTVFDVSGNEAYGPSGVYHVFAGKDASRALAQSSLKAEDCKPEYVDLGEKEKRVLSEWFIYFSKRYNIVGKVHN